MSKSPAAGAQPPVLRAFAGTGERRRHRRPDLLVDDEPKILRAAGAAFRLARI